MRIVSRLEQAEGLDRLVTFGQRAARLLPPGKLRDGLNGVWLGHAVHPSLVAVTAAAGLYGVSLAAGDARRSRILRFAGLAAAGTGGLLGGHISFRLAGGVNHAEAVPHLVEPGWHDVAAVESLPADRPARVLLGEVPLLVVADGERFHVLAERCSHLSGPLSDGDLGDGCVTCPWHGSIFRLADGSVARGVATAPQPVLRTRTRDGVLQVCLPDAG